MSSLNHELLDELNALRAANRWRATAARAEGTCFSSNDYLNLSCSEALITAAQQTLAAWGTGATASRLMAGHLPPHASLETALAGFLDTEAALVFPSGYQANIGLITALAGREAWLFSDALNHASLIDGARLSRARVSVYPHADAGALEAQLRAAPAGVRKIIVTESVFSMDGDCAPVEALAELARANGAWLVVDEAHALGVYGAGRGLCAARGAKPDVVLGTLSKALASQGGFVACSAVVRDLLVNRARTFIFSTGLAPASAAAAEAALTLLASTPGLGATLLRNAAAFRDALRAHGIHTPGESQIVPIVLGSEAAALRAADHCRARGLSVHAIRPPTVPEGACRLRLSVTLAHPPGELARAAQIIAEACR